MTITAFRHPLSAREVTLPGPSRPLRLAIGIDVQNQLCDLTPIGAFDIGIKQTQVRYKMLFIVSG
jgi:hypothetical protein